MTWILLVGVAFLAGAATATWITRHEECDDCGYRAAHLEDLRNESRANHPAFSGVDDNVIALREALEDRDGSEPA